MTLIMAGEAEERSAPLVTWARALERAGCSCVFMDLATTDLMELIRAVGAANALVYQCYGVTHPFVARQLALATFLGCPVVRKWSGTDVWNCLHTPTIREDARRLDRLVASNVTSEHPGLVSELESIGIQAKLTSQVTTRPLPSLEEPLAALGSNVMIYLPDGRHDFYNRQLMAAVIESNPDLPFCVVADESHSLAAYSNVQSIGWVPDLEGIWPDVGVVLRITEHDGLSRTVVEALVRGRIVIHNQHVPGVWYANDLPSVNACLQRFRQSIGDNRHGRAALLAYLGESPECRLRDVLLSSRVTVDRRGIAAAIIGRTQAKRWLRRIFRVHAP